ncbi:hypothetical protein M3182_24755 [Mesobacillus maritimus]|uniref:hypothetical protein n=1 Tax=Mesobacillus maritimus TaxID=1643336 RepID=UPI00203F8541|nr:hypothetical protein [Mesobacillus maritimus]MCM3588838.1 hypothetical protein [Mesobacillus maritimus]
MIGIIKRPKTKGFAQIDNKTYQEDLKDIRAMGLLSYLMTLPTNWQISKTHLYAELGKGLVAAGIRVLEQKGYWVQITYRSGSKNLHSYSVSDLPFSDLEINEMIWELADEGFKIKSISEPFSHLLAEVEDVFDCKNEEALQGNRSCSSSVIEKQQLETSTSTLIAEIQHLKTNTSSLTVEKEHLLNKQEKINKKEINNIKINKNKTRVENHHQINKESDEFTEQALKITDDDFNRNNHLSLNDRVRKISEKFLYLRNRGDLLSVKDIHSIENIANLHVPLETLLIWMDQIFDKYGKSSPQQTINSMSYYEAAIRSQTDVSKHKGLSIKRKETLQERLERLDKLGLLD